jgi:hypothetical protein
MQLPVLPGIRGLSMWVMIAPGAEQQANRTQYLVASSLRTPNHFIATGCEPPIDRRPPNLGLKT